MVVDEKIIAALYVESEGVYSQLDGVEVWGIEKDARRYLGPHPVVAHPPCKRWGRYWNGGPNAKTPRLKGDDEGCFKSAITDVRTWGGVLEHPEASHAWVACGLTKPPKDGGWIPASDGLGYTCCVEQGHYGHKARKATWLYAVRCELPELIWGPSEGQRLDDGFKTTAKRKRITSLPDYKRPKKLTAAERLATPLPFRDLLISMARSVEREEE